MIIGLARQGKALARFAARHGADVIVSDMQPAANLGPALAEMAEMNIETVVGGHPMNLLEGADTLAISGGVPTDIPIVEAARQRGIVVTNDSLEFMKRTPARVIGITGSAGKTTTTALTGLMVQHAGLNAWVGGNIGRPLIDELERMSADDVVVQELSSFQLELWDRSPHVAAVLNLTPNHLDRHKTMESYRLAKANILRHQRPEDVALLSADDDGASSMAEFCQGRLRRFSTRHRIADGAFLQADTIWLSDGAGQRQVCTLNEIPLRGAHNVLNVLASVVLADSVGVGPAAMRGAIKAFQGVEHRLEVVAIVDGVHYVNDSIATAPERALAALDAFDEPLILLAGGRDKDMVWESWARRVNERVRVAVLFGELAPKMAAYLAAAARNEPESGLAIEHAATLAEAVGIAAEVAVAGEVVLMAPGGTSFDAYRDFAERGRAFRQLVSELQGITGKGRSKREKA